MKDYEINENTLALIAIDEKTTRVYEEDEVYIVSQSANKIMENSCEYFGSSLEGRKKGTQSLIGVSHKAPIIVEETREMIFFPTTSPRLEKCSWISLKNVDKVIKKNEKNLILFKNKLLIDVNLSYGIINNQILRASRLETVLRDRKN